MTSLIGLALLSWLIVSQAHRTFMMNKVLVRIIHPINILGDITGGIDSIIRGIIEFAPSHVCFQIVGITEADQGVVKTGVWHKVEINGKTIEFFAVATVANLSTRTFVPNIVIFFLGVWRHLGKIMAAETPHRLEFHRIEAAIPFLRALCPLWVTVHQDMEVVRGSRGDIRWKYAPRVYEWMEGVVLGKARRILCVRSSAVERYKKKFPSTKISFMSTWANPRIFHAKVPSLEESSSVAECGEVYKFLFVGRLDLQKDPMALLTVFSHVVKSLPLATLEIVGVGVLERSLKDRAAELGLERQVFFLGQKKPPEVAERMRSSDVLLLTSLYEGMPVCVCEALLSGMAVASYPVGEYSMFNSNREVFRVTDERDPVELATAAIDLVRTPRHTRIEAATTIGRLLTPDAVLSQIYRVDDGAGA